MTLVKTEAEFEVFPSPLVCEQRVKLKPNKHCYENEREEPYIKYSCQLCESLFERIQDSGANNEAVKFGKFSFPQGIEQCPCFGIRMTGTETVLGGALI